MNNQNNITKVLDGLRLVSDGTRQRILFLLAAEGEQNVNQIAEHFSLSRPTISHHLNLMKRLGFLNSKKQGKEVLYSFNKEHTIGLLENFVTELKNCCAVSTESNTGKKEGGEIL